MPSSNVIFDLDGTLVDTYEATIDAYRRAGVERPEAYWGLSWREWCTEEVHDKKIRLFPESLERLAKPTELLKIALMLKSPILTGASEQSVYAIERLLGIHFNDINCEMCFEDKRRYIVSYIEEKEQYIYYVDDLPSIRARLWKELPTCLTLSPSEFLGLFWLPGRTSDFRASSPPASNRLCWSTGKPLYDTRLTTSRSIGTLKIP